MTGLFAIYLTGRRTLVYAVAFLLIALATYISISRSAALFATVLIVLYFGGGVSLSRPRAIARLLLVVGAAFMWAGGTICRVSKEVS